jgi:hypothetical protein
MKHLTDNCFFKASVFFILDDKQVIGILQSEGCTVNYNTTYIFLYKEKLGSH